MTKRPSQTSRSGPGSTGGQQSAVPPRQQPLSRPPLPSYRCPDAPDLSPLIGLSVAVGRFVEALFWAIARVVGAVAGTAILGVIGLVAVVFVVRAGLRWRARRR